MADLMRLFAIAMRLPAETFSEALKDHGSSMRAIFYPSLSQKDFTSSEVVRSPGPQPFGPLRALRPEHVDWGCITVLLADPEVSGLEVCDKEGDKRAWSAASQGIPFHGVSQEGIWTPLQPAQPDSLVVNLGAWTETFPKSGTRVAKPFISVARFYNSPSHFLLFPAPRRNAVGRSTCF